MCDNRVELANCMSIALNQSKQTLAEWMRKITLKDDFISDKLTLYCLSRFTGLHVLVYTNDFCWSILLNQFKLSDDALYEQSKIKLVYVGHHMFIKLKHIHQPKPNILALVPQPIDKTVSKKAKLSQKC